MKTGKLGVITVASLLAAVVAVSSLASGDRDSKEPRDVTLSGRIVDLHCFMTENYPSADHVKCTQDCIRSGVPAALATEDGLVIIGQGMKGPARTIASLAMKDVELTGKLFERDGVRYIDIASVEDLSGDQPEASPWNHNDSDDDDQ